jgi:alpha-galactosidase
MPIRFCCAKQCSQISLAFFAVFFLAANCLAAETAQFASLQLSNQPEAHVKTDTAIGGGALTINGEKYDHGLSMEAPGKMVINLKRGAERFQAKVGIDDDVQASGAIVTISGDDRRLWPQGGMNRGTRGGPAAFMLRAGGAASEIDLDVNNIRVLVLEVAAPPQQRRGRGAATPAVAPGHVDWINATLTYSGAAPEVPALPTEEYVVLTPKEADTPRINCAKVFGVRPGHPFLFTVATTGKRPMEFSAEGLPEGLKLDPATGFISGKTDAPGNHFVKLRAKNSEGYASSTLKIVVGDIINLTPQLGWNSWNCFGPQVTGQNVMDAADAMVKSGLVNHGWTYINIDDYWEYNANLARRGDPTMQGVTPRAADGTINTNKRFPDMKALTDHIHSLGLKAGIYSGPGPTTCGGCTASWEHEDQDAKTYADWGFDYLKYDWCSYDDVIGGRPAMTNIAILKKPYEVMNAALHKVDRDIVFSLCQYGWGDVWNWGKDVGGNSWRTTGDITDTWASLTGIWDSQTERYDPQQGAIVPTHMADFAGPGHWNDADMMIVGQVSVASGKEFHKTNLSPNEQFTHVTAWIMMACPMLIGCDMTKFDDFTLGLLANDEVLAVNQDPLGKAGRRIIDKTKGGGFEIWTKELDDGSKAVAIFNRSELEGNYTLKLADIDLKGKQSVHDIWRQKDLGTASDQYETIVPRHGVVLLKMTQARK